MRSPTSADLDSLSAEVAELIPVREQAFLGLTMLARRVCRAAAARIVLFSADGPVLNSWSGSGGVAPCDHPSCAEKTAGFSAGADSTGGRRPSAHPTAGGVEGAPARHASVVLSVTGVVVGRLCVSDDEPAGTMATAAFTDEETRLLTLIARQVESGLQLRPASVSATEGPPDPLAPVLSPPPPPGGSSTPDATSLGRDAASPGDDSRWRSLIESSGVAVVVLGDDGLFRYANPQALTLYGMRSFAQLSRRQPVEFVPPRLVDATRNLFVSVLRGASIVDRPWTFQRADGSLVHIDITATRVLYDDGVAVQVELRDVSVQRRAQHALERSERRYRALFDHSPIGVLECLADGTILDLNDTLCSMLDRPRSDLVGRSSAVLVAEDERAQQQADIAALRETGAYSRRRTYRRRDGSELPVQVTVTMVYDAESDAERVLASVADISHQVLAEQRLAAANDELRKRQIFTDALLDSVDVGVVACNADGELTVFNRTTQHWHGLDIDGDASRHPEQFADAFDLFDQDGTPLATSDVPILRALRDGKVSDVEIVIGPPDRAATRVQCSGRSLVDADGRLLGAVVAMTDITESRARQEALEASHSRFRSIFDTGPTGLAILTADGLITQANASFRELTRLDQAATPQHRLHDIVAPATRPALTAQLMEAVRRRGEPVSADVALTVRSTRVAATAAGVPYADDRRTSLQDKNVRSGAPAPSATFILWCRLTMTFLPDPDTGDGVLLQIDDITESRRKEKQLIRRASRDGLTDLPNRTLLLERVDQALNNPSTDVCHVFALFLDLDGFKAVNDTHGHAAGDHLLIEISRRLAMSIRPQDTVGRLGGDEFLLLCQGLEDETSVTALVDRVLTTVAQPVDWRGHELSVSASIGVAQASPGDTAEQLLHAADLAMYEAKRRGKNQHARHDASPLS